MKFKRLRYTGYEFVYNEQMSFITSGFFCTIFTRCKRDPVLNTKYIESSGDVLVFLNLCKILVSARFCGVCAR